MYKKKKTLSGSFTEEMNEELFFTKYTVIKANMSHGLKISFNNEKVQFSNRRT